MKFALLCTLLLVIVIAVTAITVKDNLSSTNLNTQSNWEKLTEETFVSDDDSKAAIERFQEYLRIKTVHPNVDYKPAVQFLLKQAEELGLESSVHEYVADKPVVVLKWIGKDDGKRKSVLYNSHMDVVPVDDEKWILPAFDASIKDGKIYARGSQDMKSVGLGYLEAIRLLKKSGYQPSRTIVLSYVPEEEIGGADGAAKFVFSEDFTKLNIGISIDEGGPNMESHQLKLYYGERLPWWVVIKATGDPGHGSQFVSNLAVRKLYRAMDKIYRFREEQERLMKLTNTLTGDVVTVNVNGFKAGHGSSINVIPSDAELYIDMRIPPHVDLHKIYDMIKNHWCEEEGVSFSFAQNGDPDARNPVTNLDSAFAHSIRGLAKDLGISLTETIFPAATDSRFSRLVDSTGKVAKIPTFGISPLHQTPWLLHDHNEYLPVDVYKQAIVFYRELMKTIDATPVDEA